MATPFLPREIESQQLAAYRQFSTQMQQIATDRRTVDRSRELVALYGRRPWLTPGIATSYVKWKDEFGQKAARGLSRAVLEGAQSDSGAADPAAQTGPQSFAGTPDEVEEFLASKDFERQVKDYREGRLNDKDWVQNRLDDKTLPKAQRLALAQDYALKKFNNGGFLASAPNIGALPQVIAGEAPGVGTPVKGVSRVAFTAMESGYQEMQAAGSAILANTVGAFQQAAQSTATGRAPVSNDVSSIAPTALGGTRPEEGLIVGGGSPFGTSTGAIALERLLAGEEVDLGTGYFPGGEVQEEHVRRVREIAKFVYDGKQHFATPGRILAAAVTEPGTDPFNLLSGSLDAIALVKGDPTLLAGAKLEAIKEARRGFSTAEQLAGAGGFSSWVRSFTHGPTVDSFLDEQRRGAELIDDLTENLAGQPENMLGFMRRSGWKWPVDVYTSITQAQRGDRAAVRAIMGSALGTSISEQPKLRTFAASLRNSYQQSRLFAEVPTIETDLTSMSGPNGGARNLYNQAVGLGLDDGQISRVLYDVLSSSGRVERADNLRIFFDMQGQAMRNMGLPEQMWKRFSAFAIGDMNGKARVYFDGLIAEGDGPPGLILDGNPTLIEGPYLPSEYLGDKLFMPKLLGKDGRNRALAKYGRIMGIPGTGFTDLQEVGALKSLAPSAYHAVRDRVFGGNAWLINAQNKVWKPVALLRGAWTLRVIGEEQVRMAMAGYDSLFSHPLRYLMQNVHRGKVGSDAEKQLLNWGADQGALRHAQESAWGFNDRTADPIGRAVARITETQHPGDPYYTQLWADNIIRYHSDEVMSALATELTNAGDDAVGARAAFLARFMTGDLQGARADLARSSSLLRQGINTADPDGAVRYVDGLFERLHYYTGGDPGLIETIATGRYRPTGMVGRRVDYDGMGGEIVEHQANAKNVKVMFDDNTVEEIALSQLDVGEIPIDRLPRVLTRTADNVKVDPDFKAHLDSFGDDIKPRDNSGIREIHDPDREDAMDAVVRSMFGFLMDRPTTYMSRSPVFVQAYLDEIERLLPHVDSQGQRQLLDQAAQILHQSDDHAIRGLVLKGRYKKLEKAAETNTIDGLSFDEADEIAKGHSIDTMRELLYDAHKRNRSLAAMQLIFPFGEAFKEMIGSWTRIVGQKPITSARKFQIFVTEARSGNPFDFLPGGDSLPGNGFFFKDPQREGEEMYAAPFMGAINEQLFGVRADEISPVKGLSMGLQLLPGVGPVVSFPAMQLMNRFMQDPKWDPLRQIIGPYAGKEPVPIAEAFVQQFAPGWARKWMTSIDGNLRGNSQSARALNGLTIDIMTAGRVDGTYDMSTKQGIDDAFDDAYKKARQLYMFTGTFQFGSPSAPSVDLIVDPKNDKATRLVMMRDEYFKLVKKDKKNGTHDAAAIFINRYGEEAMFVAGPKTLGTSFGQQYTERTYDWMRRNDDVVKKYPLTYPEYGPRAKEGEKFSYDAYLRTLNMGERETVDPKEWANGVNNILGTMWYDKYSAEVEADYKNGDISYDQKRMLLADKRVEIGENYHGWRLGKIEPARTAKAVMELYEAADDPKLAKSNPGLMSALRRYIAFRDTAIEVARSRNRYSDLVRPGFSSSNDTWDLREGLRVEAARLGKENEQFLTLWEDTFEHEMKDD